jgi:hypothetical protein
MIVVVVVVVVVVQVVYYASSLGESIKVCTSKMMGRGNLASVVIDVEWRTHTVLSTLWCVSRKMRKN